MAENDPASDREAIITNPGELEYFDREGNPLTLEQWGVMLEDIDARRVAKTTINVSGGLVDVSTVWIGIDHGWGEGRPLIFETMVFGGSMNEQTDRYATEAEALAGHEAMCDWVRAS